MRVKGMAYDTPVLGYRVNTCNTLRLWRSEAVESFDFQDFNVGDYYGAVQEKVISETMVASRSWWKFRFGVLRVGEASPRQAARSRV